MAAASGSERCYLAAAASAAVPDVETVMATTQAPRRRRASWRVRLISSGLSSLGAVGQRRRHRRGYAERIWRGDADGEGKEKRRRSEEKRVTVRSQQGRDTAGRYASG